MNPAADPNGMPALPKQFLITRKRIEPPASWQSLRLGDRYLFSSPSLPVTMVIPDCPSSAAGEMFVVLGWFCAGDTFYPNESGGVLRTSIPIESLYREMTGRFVILCANGTRLRCMTDPGALMPLVFRPDTDEAASTPGALSLSEPVTRSEAIQQSFQRKDSATWYPFGVTPFADVHRVQPASVLDLPSGTTAPIPQVSSPATSERDAVERMHLVARKFIGALANSGTLDCHLTAGWDSRMVLSAGLGTRADIEYLTYRAPGTNGSVDCLMAQRIASAYSLRHRLITVNPAHERDVEAWIHRTSGCIEDSVMNLTTTVAETYIDRYVLCGLAGEVGRAFYWRATDIGGIGLGARDLLARLGFVQSRHAVRLAEHWLSGHALESTPDILDQAYIDIRLGGWAGPSLYGHPVSKPTLTPFNNAMIFALMRSLPDRYRQSGQFAKDFVAHGSTGLARYPVNRATGIKRLRYIRREIAACLPKGVKNSLRSLAGR